MSRLFVMKFAPLLTAFVLMAIVLSGGDRLYFLQPICLIGGVLVATFIAAVYLKRSSPPTSKIEPAVVSYFTAAGLASLGSAHAVGVILAAMHRAREHLFAYNFRFYLLVLLGVLLLAAGFIAMNAVDGLARGERGAWWTSLIVWAAIVAITLPLASLQQLALLPTMLAFLEMLALGAVRGNSEVKPAGDA